MEGALSSTKAVLVETSRSRNLESAVSSGGKAVVAAQKDVLIKGSSLAAEGKLIVAGDAVTVEAGRDIDRSSTTVTTLSLFKADASGKAAAVAGTEGRARVIDQSQVEALKTVDGELVQDVNGGASRKNDLSVVSKRSSEISVATDEKGKFSGHIASPGWDEKVARNETGSKGGDRCRSSQPGAQIPGKRAAKPAADRAPRPARRAMRPLLQVLRAKPASRLSSMSPRRMWRTTNALPAPAFPAAM
jgi:hypothetical protein